MTVKGQETETDNFDVVTSEADDIGIDNTEKPIDTNSLKKEEEKSVAPEDENDPKKEEDDDKGEKEKAEKAAGDTSADGTKTDTKRSPSRFQKRIDRKTKQVTAAEERAEKAEKRAEAAEKKLADSSKADSASDVEPEPSDYDDYDDYLKALEDFNGKEPEKKAEPKPKEEPKKVEKAAKAEEADDELMDALDDTESSFDTARERYADFDDVIGNKDVNITRDMVIAMSDSDNAGDIAYHLGKNEDEANRIADLSPIAQAKEIGKLEVKLAKKPPAEKRQTSAPAPINPVGGSDATDKAVEDMDFSEFEAHQNKKEAKSGNFW
jgi:hypothetical protein